MLVDPHACAACFADTLTWSEDRRREIENADGVDLTLDSTQPIRFCDDCLCECHHSDDEDNFAAEYMTLGEAIELQSLKKRGTA